MNIAIITICGSGLLIGVGITIFCLYGQKKENLLKKMNNALAKNMELEKEEKLFQGTHYSLSLYRYNQMRILISAFGFMAGMAMVNKTFIILSVAVYLLMWPKEKIGIIKMPFHFIDKFYRKRDKADKDGELLEILMLLKNLMIQLRNSPKGADYIIEYLLGVAELTKPAFLKFLNQLRLGQPENAESIFIEEIGTQLAADTARILVQLDNVEPITLEQSLISIQNEIKEIGNTYKQTKNELYSDLILIPIILTIMLEFLNFLVVSYIEELSAFNNFFGL